MGVKETTHWGVVISGGVFGTSYAASWVLLFDLLVHPADLAEGAEVFFWGDKTACSSHV